MASKNKIRVGFIGCGGIMRGHFDRVSKNPHAQIVALSDNSDASMGRFVERCPSAKGLPVYCDYREMLAKEKLDAVEIATPHTLHFEQAMAAFDKGLHVLLEKPMVCSVAHAKKLLKKAEETGKVLQVSYQRHFGGAYRYVRQAIAKGEIGKVHFVTAQQSQEWYRNQQGAWRQKACLSGGGQLNDSGSHLLDIVLWMTDLVPAEVFAFIDNFDTEVDILTAMSVKYRGGAMGTFSVVGHSTFWWEDISIWGDKGGFFIRNGGEFVMRDENGKNVDVKAQADKMDAGDPDTNFINAILGKEEVQVPGVCGLRVIQLTEAAWQSGKTGQVAKVKR